MRSMRNTPQYSLPCALREGANACALRLAAVAVAAMTGACSLSMPMGSIKDDSIVTGSVPDPAAALSSKLNDEDWRRAQSALGVAVDPQGNGAPVSWDNPESGRKGSFVAAGPLYLLNDKVCRSFIATVDLPGTPGPDQKMQGASCRNGPNDWTVKEAKPWKG